MLEVLLTFAPVAVVLCLTPGPATALVIRSALRGGRHDALLTCAGNSCGILLWAVAAALGVAALVAASEIAFTVLKLVGGAYLVYLGIQAWRDRGNFEVGEATPREGRQAVRDGLITSFANPKLAVFFVALLPQFIPADAAVLPHAIAMALLLIACDIVWFSILATLVVRARGAFISGPWPRIAERTTGTVLIALGVGLARTRTASA
jgi:threonine/homoserine/homoserine lactone efflux protein